MGILSILAGPLFKLLGQVLPDPQAKQAAQLKLMELMQSGQLAELDAETKTILAQGGIIQAEAASKSWIAASWRPITSLVFVALIVARMFGWTAVNVTQAEYLELWSLMKLCLGGYIGARTVEKVLPGATAAITSAIKGK